jgi:hypothetical protein
MSKKYQFTAGWKRWAKGQVIDEYEYKRLPIEVKNACIVEVEELKTVEVLETIPDPVQVVPEKSIQDHVPTKEKKDPVIPKNPFSARAAWNDPEKDLEKD